MLPRYKKKKDVIYNVKKELHIVYESFLIPNGTKRALDIIEGNTSENILDDKSTNLELMRLHVSTKERVDTSKEIYSFIANYINEDSTISDIGCGYNPIGLLSNIEIKPNKYYAYEISSDTVNVLNAYFDKAKVSNSYKAELFDAMNEVPVDCNVLLAFKLLPILELSQKGRSKELLDQANFDIAIISFPLKSLSGKAVGMEANYSRFFESDLNYKIVVKRIINNELFYVIEK